MRKIYVKYGTFSHLAAYACQQSCEFVLNLSLVVKLQNAFLDFPWERYMCETRSLKRNL